MAIQVRNAAAVNCGTNTGAARTATHGLVGFGGRTMLKTRLSSPKVYATGDAMELPAEEIRLTYPAGNMDDDGMDDMLALYFAQQVTVDLLSDEDTVFNGDGYAQATVSGAGWTRTEMDDP